MTESDPRKIVELYNVMETKLNELGITFDEFSVLYKTYQATIAAGIKPPETEQKEEAVSPFPWVKFAGYGKYS